MKLLGKGFQAAMTSTFTVTTSSSIVLIQMMSFTKERSLSLSNLGHISTEKPILLMM